jgi:hypothetical protein
MNGDLLDHIPHYLPEADQAALLEQLRDFENRNYYTRLFPDELLQGDGWFGFEVVNFFDGRKDLVRGILFSNSCDIDAANVRDFPSRAVFAPLIRVSSYIEFLERSVEPSKIIHKLEAIRRQRVTSLFYLPKGGALEEDHIAVLDDLHSVPLSAFRSNTNRAKLFTLSQMGAYLFLLKISIHFCRFSENLARG